jgi:putative ABC transport system substrate-binding protein
MIGDNSIRRAVQAASPTIPIVGFLGNDPVRSGVVRSFNRPGGNITGVITFRPEMTAKRLALLHDLLPQATSLGVPLNPTGLGANPQLTDLQGAARALGLQIKPLNASTDNDIDAVFASMAQSRPMRSCDQSILLHSP